MQLKRKKLVSSLAAATCSLLAAAPGQSIAEEDGKWKFDTAFLYYGESDRVDDISGNIHVSRSFDGNRILTLRLGVDSLTGASGNGAKPFSTPQTFTSPSGNKTYTTAAFKTPLDPTFLDTRVSLSGNWAQDVGNKSRFNVGASFSNEYDYFHMGVNGKYFRDFNGRNTTLSLGLAFAKDDIEPVGGAPIGLSPMLPVGDVSNRLGDDDKTVVDFLIGVSHVLGKRTIGQLNYTLSQSDGYLTDPYKLISVVDPISGDPVAGPGTDYLYRFEARPDSRTKHSLFGQVRHHLNRDIVDASYRFMTDDWGVQSHTVDFRYKWKWRPSWYLEPHLRYYTQTEADFFVYSLFDGDPLPDEASADYRLGELQTYTAGLKVGKLLGGRKELSFRLEYYNQSGDDSPGDAVGSQRNFDLFPTVDAIIGQVGFKF